MTQQRVKEMKAKQALMQWKCSGCESVRLNRKRQTSCRICGKKKTGEDRVGWPCQFKSKFTQDMIRDMKAGLFKPSKFGNDREEYDAFRRNRRNLDTI
jgi:hypothetical protein